MTDLNALLELPGDMKLLVHTLDALSTRFMARIDQLETTIKELESRIPRMLLRRKAAAKHLKISQRTVDRWIEMGRIQTVQEGKTILCDVTGLRPVDVKKVTERVVLGSFNPKSVGTTLDSFFEEKGNLPEVQELAQKKIDLSDLLGGGQ